MTWEKCSLPLLFYLFVKYFSRQLHCITVRFLTNHRGKGFFSFVIVVGISSQKCCNSFKKQLNKKNTIICPNSSSAPQHHHLLCANQPSKKGVFYISDSFMIKNWNIFWLSHLERTLVCLISIGVEVFFPNCALKKLRKLGFWNKWKEHKL